MSVFIVMGVSGAGKSTVAEALAKTLDWPFQEGDALHPPANVQKMHAGTPLTDADRAPWLDAIKRWIDARVGAGESGLITCSALKRAYRDRLVAGRSAVCILYLKADRDVLEQRVAARNHPFMPASLLQSQVATLEEPAADEHAITVRVDGELAQTLAACLAAISRASIGPDDSHH